jgi:hypothetical protein
MPRHVYTTAVCYHDGMSRWLARLSFTFFVIAVLLFWQIYKALSDGSTTVTQGRLSLYILGCACAITLGAIGVRARHRPGGDD